MSFWQQGTFERDRLPSDYGDPPKRTKPSETVRAADPTTDWEALTPEARDEFLEWEQQKLQDIQQDTI